MSYGACDAVSGVRNDGVARQFANERLPIRIKRGAIIGAPGWASLDTEEAAEGGVVMPDRAGYRLMHYAAGF